MCALIFSYTSVFYYIIITVVVYMTIIPKIGLTFLFNFMGFYMYIVCYYGTV